MISVPNTRQRGKLCLWRVGPGQRSFGTCQVSSGCEVFFEGGAAKKLLQTLVCFGRLTHGPQSHLMFSVSKWPEMILQVGPFCSACLCFGKTLSAEENQPFEHHPKQHQDVGLDKLCGLRQSQDVRWIIPRFCWNQLCLMTRVILLFNTHTHKTPLYVDDLQWTVSPKKHFYPK